MHFIFLLLTLSTVQASFRGTMVAMIEGDEDEYPEPPETDTLLDEYDFVIVGAGSAGCVIANRLSENPEWKILLIEAGPAENSYMDIPILANYLQFTKYNWNYTTEPDGKTCLGFKEQKCNMPRGKVVGGSSVLNYMIYTRGNRRDYDRWAELGNDGWAWKDVLPYFQKLENFNVPSNFTHGHDGPLNVDYAPYRTKIATSVVKASQQYGLPYVEYDGPSQIGVSHLHLTTKGGNRFSSSRAYLHPIGNRSNLHITKLSMVTEIIIDKKTKQAQGVKMKKGDKMYTIKATKEVIVSAGAMNSPQLLMLSGVGPKKHLKKMDIPLIKNLKVGYNFMDHVLIGGVTYLINETISVKTTRVMEDAYVEQYIKKQTGPMTIPGGCEVIVFQDLDHPDDLDGYPDIELLYVSGSLVSDDELKNNFGITNELFDPVFKPIEGGESFMVFPILMRPKSRGRLTLRSNNYQDKPIIRVNYLDDPADVKVLIKGLRLAVNISNQEALQAIGAKLHDIPIPQCSQHKFGTDEYFECMTRHLTFNVYHYSGTCKMGPSSDRAAVVGPRLKVHGVKKLRVIDASIFPEIITGHPNGPIMMIAEKGSDMIKQDWGFL